MRKNPRYISIGLQWLIGIGLTYTALWTIAVAPDWTPFPGQHTRAAVLFVAALIVFGIEPEMERWLRRFAGKIIGVRVGTHGRASSSLPASRRAFLRRRWRIIATGGLLALLALILPANLAGYGWVMGVFLLLLLALGLLRRMLRERSWASLGNLSLSLISLLIMLVVIELVAPAATRYVAEAQHRNAVEMALENARHPMTPEEITGAEVTRSSGSPQSEWIVPGEGAAWGLLTGWGTRADAVMRYWLDGVYDVEVVYNQLGFRGPAISYEKPDDVYRILIIGDSFIEAREVNYEDTVYAQLGALLADARTPDGRRSEVFGVGAVGWGTLQAYLYYQHEGVRFAPDLIIHAFFINDVADNYPAFFYPDRQIDFAVSDTETSVQLLTNAVAPLPSERQAGVRWLEALPSFLGDSATAGLLRRVIDPPREMVTLGAIMGNWHPQNFIFVRLPEIEGYAEAWRRTARAYAIWNAEVQNNGAELMVLAIDYPEERVTELAATFIGNEEQPWIWDADLPYTRLAEILDPLGVDLILTRARYADYARLAGLRPFDALFYVADGHWNPTGHRLTAELLAEVLQQKGVVE